LYAEQFLQFAALVIHALQVLPATPHGLIGEQYSVSGQQYAVTVALGYMIGLVLCRIVALLQSSWQPTWLPFGVKVRFFGQDERVDVFRQPAALQVNFEVGSPGL
jgi:hypothetical protein